MQRNFDVESNVIKNMAREIVRECAQAGMVTSQELAIYMVRLKLLDPHKGYSTTTVMSRKMTQSLVEVCVKELGEDNPTINGLRLQVFWNCNEIGRDEVKREHHRVVYNRSLPVMKEILESMSLSKEDIQQLYKKIIVFTVMYSGLGNPTSHSVLREANPALHSVFKTSELENFVGLSRKEKEQQLQEFTKIVTGIRLFNKDCQKGGEGIDDLPVILVQAVHATRERMNNTKEQIKNRINQLSSAIAAAYHLDWAIEQLADTELVLFLPPGFRKDELEDMKKILIIMRQHEVCLKKLFLDLEQSNESVLNLVDQLQKTLVRLHDVVRYRAAVPTVQVYPLFIELSGVWTQLQDETACLSHVNTVLVNLNSINKYFEPLPLEKALCPQGTMSERHLDESPINALDDFHPDVAVLSSTKVPQLNQLKVQLAGFCAWTIAQTDGALVDGNQNIGLLEYKNRAYAFSTAEVAYKWAKDPENYLMKMYAAARMKPAMVKLLNLLEDLEVVSSEKLVMPQKQIKVTQNAEVQTELHPLPSYIDKDYTFSEWELKRRALRLSQVVKCSTKSQQTVSHSHFRTDKGCEVAPDKSQSTQTKKDNWCNHPTISNFIWGLRGRSDEKAHVITLTRPIDDELRLNSMPKL